MIGRPLAGLQEGMLFSRRRQRPVDEPLFDTRTVDFVALSPDRSTVALVIVVDSAWTGSEQQRESLREKIGAYVGYAAGGQLEQEQPQLAGLPWEIRVGLTEDVDPASGV